jgi:hypothetical protein
MFGVRDPLPANNQVYETASGTSGDTPSACLQPPASPQPHQPAGTTRSSGTRSWLQALHCLVRLQCDPAAVFRQACRYFGIRKDGVVGERHAGFIVVLFVRIPCPCIVRGGRRSRGPALVLGTGGYVAAVVSALIAERIHPHWNSGLLHRGLSLDGPSAG